MQATKETTAQPATVSQEKRTMRDYFVLMLKGVAMGASDIVPGVSGGTMAFIMGIYQELIDSIRAVGQPPFLRALFQFHIRKIFEIVNWKFLLALLIGIGTAVVTLSSGLEWLLENQPVYLWSFFFGLVLASVYTVSKRINQWRPPLLLILGLATLAAFFLVGAVPLDTPNDWWFLFLSGALAICAMILPGISGAFILVLLGKYQFVLSAVNSRDIISIGIVGIGAVIGLVTFAQIIGYFFKRYHDYTIAALTGLMIGSLRKIWPWRMDVAWLTDAAGNFVLDSHGERRAIQEQLLLPDFATAAGLTEFGIAVVLALIGFALILILDQKSITAE